MEIIAIFLQGVLGVEVLGLIFLVLHIIFLKVQYFILSRSVERLERELRLLRQRVERLELRLLLQQFAWVVVVIVPLENIVLDDIDIKDEAEKHNDCPTSKN